MKPKEKKGKGKGKKEEGQSKGAHPTTESAIEAQGFCGVTLRIFGDL